MPQTEIETTYLASALPGNLSGYHHEELVDVYFPADSVHPKLRIRQKGGTYMLTKKNQVEAGDASVQLEENVELSEAEFNSLRAGRGKVVSKVRYLVSVGDHTAELDVFTGDLAGLVLVDFEFKSTSERDAFKPPDFCGPDVTQEEFIAGGMLAGKKLPDIQAELDRLHYRPLHLN